MHAYEVQFPDCIFVQQRRQINVIRSVAVQSVSLSSVFNLLNRARFRMVMSPSAFLLERICGMFKVVRCSGGLQSFNLFTAGVRHCSSQLPKDNLLHDDMPLDRKIEIDPLMHQQKMKLPPDCSDDSKLLKVAILGSPNAGKSVLTNQLVGATISSVSSKVHTTRHNTKGVTNEGRVQLIFMDTPGVVSPAKAKEHELEQKLVADPEAALQTSNLIAVLVDASNKKTRESLHPRILHLLYRYRQRKRSILVLNKIDVIESKTKLLELTSRLTNGFVSGRGVDRKMPKLLETVDKNTTADGEVLGVNMTDHNVDQKLLERLVVKPASQVYDGEIRKCFGRAHGWPYFDEVFMVSALTGVGLEPLKQYLVDHSQFASWQYHSSVVSDLKPTEFVVNAVRSKLLDHLKQEIPYQLKIKIDVWEVNEHDVLCIRANVLCPNDRIAQMVIGPGGQQIHQISMEANQELRNVFQRDVFLKLGVYSEKGGKK